jgi:hypothetical protein
MMILEASNKPIYSASVEDNARREPFLDIAIQDPELEFIWTDKP